MPHVSGQRASPSTRAEQAEHEPRPLDRVRAPRPPGGAEDPRAWALCEVLERAPGNSSRGTLPNPKTGHRDGDSLGSIAQPHKLPDPDLLPGPRLHGETTCPEGQWTKCPPVPESYEGSTMLGLRGEKHAAACGPGQPRVAGFCSHALHGLGWGGCGVRTDSVSESPMACGRQ